MMWGCSPCTKCMRGMCYMCIDNRAFVSLQKSCKNVLEERHFPS
jgi:hypothetical protein